MHALLRRSLVAVAVLSAACAEPSATRAVVTEIEPGFAKGGGGGASAVKRVVVAPASVALSVGGTAQLSATAFDRSGSPVPGVIFTWSSSAPNVASVSATGSVTGVASGTATVTATGGGKVGTASVTVSAPPPPPPVGETLIAAGDIAVCSTQNDEATAAVVAGIPGTVAVLGDNAYENGSATDYANCYDPSWGAFKARTRPSVGNHEYQTAGAAGYYGYFGAAAGDPSKGYYSYDLGAWHVIVLNSNCAAVSCAAGSAQEQWLRSDLAATTKGCVLAYWHHPRFNSGASHGNNSAVAPFWQALYEARADVVLNGHEHLYERFALQRPDQVASPDGIRQFTVGTGGRALYSIGTVQPNSQVRNNATFGVLQLTLGTSSYGWTFRPVAGQSFTDSGSESCH